MRLHRRAALAQAGSCRWATLRGRCRWVGTRTSWYRPLRRRDLPRRAAANVSKTPRTRSSIRRVRECGEANRRSRHRGAVPTRDRRHLGAPRRRWPMTLVMPASNYRMPGGLSWEELATILQVAIALGRSDRSQPSPSPSIQSSTATGINRSGVVARLSKGARSLFRAVVCSWHKADIDFDAGACPLIPKADVVENRLTH